MQPPASVRSRIGQRGLLYLAGIGLCKIVPAWLMRFRAFSIYRLGVEESERELGGTVRLMKSDSPAQLARICKSPTAEGEHTTGWEFQREGEMVGGLWLAFDHFAEDELGLEIRLSPDATWLFSSFVLPEYRRQGIYDTMLRQLLIAQRKQTKVLAAISSHNRASLAAHQRYIQEKVASVFAIRCCGLTWSVALPNRLLKRNELTL